MPKIIYIEHNGTEHAVDVEPGKSVMQAAVENLLPGIVGDCGGCCTCATCHAYVDEAWLDKLPPATDDEKMMLDGVQHLKANSRLCCQLAIQPELDGIVLRLPESQF